MKTASTTAGLVLLLLTAASPAAAQCRFKDDSRHATRLRIELVGAGEVTALRLEVSRQGAAKVEFPVRQEEDGAWIVKPTWPGFRICEIDLRPIVSGYDVQGPTSCDYVKGTIDETHHEWDARYVFAASPVLSVGLEVDPSHAPVRFWGRPRDTSDAGSECLPDDERWRPLTSGEADRELATRAREALLADPALSSFAIEVRAHQKVVLLEGRVASDELVAAAELVAEVQGATRVDTTQLKVSPRLAGLARLPSGEETLAMVLRDVPYLLPLDPDALAADQGWKPSIDELANLLFPPKSSFATRNKGTALTVKKQLLAGAGVRAVTFRKQ